MPMSWPVAVKTRGDRRRRRERDRLHPGRDGAVRAGPGERRRGRRASSAGSARPPRSVSVHSAMTVLPWPPRRSTRCDGFLSPPMFASRTARLGFTGARSMHVAHVQRVAVAGHHVRPDRVAGRPRPEHVAHRPDDVRLHLAQLRVPRERTDRLAPASQSRIGVELAFEPARERDRLGGRRADEAAARVIAVVEHVRAESARLGRAFAPRKSEIESPPSVLASGT